MRLGLCAEPVGYALEQIRLGLRGCSLIRFDLTPEDREFASEKIARVRGYGFTPLAILGLPYPAPTMTDVAINAYADWAATVCAQNALGVVEILNEPRILGHWPPEWYRWTAEAACRAITAASPETHILLAGEMLQPDRKGPRPVKWWQQATDGISLTLYDGVAIHPYREPGPPEKARIGGTSCFGRGATRETEYRWIRGQANGKPIWITEVGWRLGEGGVDERTQADYLRRELDLAEANGVEAVVIYAAIGKNGTPMNFGVWNDSGTMWMPRPAVDTLAEWMEARP